MNRLKQIEEEIINCDQCPTDRIYKPEFGWGDSDRPMFMFIGQSPGFSNPEGLRGNSQWDRFFLELIKPFGLYHNDQTDEHEDNFYFTNLVKIPTKLDALPKEVLQHCADHVMEEIAAVQPQHIITLGRFPFQYLLNHPRRKGRVNRMTHPSAIRYNQISREDWIKEFETLVTSINNYSKRKE